MNKYLEDGIPLAVAALGGLYAYATASPSDAAYAVVIALVIKTLNSLVGSSTTTPAAAPATPPA